MARKTAFDRIFADLADGLGEHPLARRKLIYTPFTEVDPVKLKEFMHADPRDPDRPDGAWLGWLGNKPLKSLDAAEELKFMQDYSRARGSQFDFMVQYEPNGPYIAYADIMCYPHQKGAEIGFWVLPSWRDKGVATRITHDFYEQLSKVAPKIGIRDMVAETRPEYVTSQHVLERSGMVKRAEYSHTRHGRSGERIEYVRPLDIPSQRGR